MSLKSVVQQLRQLPYTEMKALAQQVCDAMKWGQPSPIQVADVLSSLPSITNDELDNEQRLLAAFFSKKRALTITTGGGSKGPWTVTCAGGVQFTDSTLRGALSGFLDAQAAYTALRK